MSNEQTFTEDRISDAIILKIISRSKQGMQSYGVSLFDNNTKSALEWIDDAIEEALDQCVYLEKLKVALHDRIKNG